MNVERYVLWIDGWINRHILLKATMEDYYIQTYVYKFLYF